MTPAAPLLEDAREDDAEETPVAADEPDDETRSLDDIIDAYARANPEESTTPRR